MKLLKFCGILIILAVLYPKYTKSQCNRCFEKVACVDQTHFAMCRNGIQLPSKIPCTDGKICTDDTLICHSPAAGYEAACFVDYCGSCEFTDGRFACLDETSYAFCAGQTEPPLNPIHKCPQNKVCNIHNAGVCTPAETSVPSCIPSNGDTTISTTVASTPTTTPIITTQAPRNADTLCADMQREGRFRADGDTTCKVYIFCFSISGQYFGNQLFCESFFNAVTQECQKERPADC